MTHRDDETPAAGQGREGQEIQAPQRYQPQQVPSIRELYPATVRALADAALRLFEALESESYAASYGLDYRLRLFRERMISELFPQPTSAAESTALIPLRPQDRDHIIDELDRAARELAAEDQDLEAQIRRLRAAILNAIAEATEEVAG